MKNNLKSDLLWVMFLGLCLSGCGQPNLKNEALAAPSSESPESAKFSTKTPLAFIATKFAGHETPSNEPTQTVPTPAITTQPINASKVCKKIAFVLLKGNISNIYAICPDGSQLTQLTHDSSMDTFPTWSPDGTKIAFASSRSGNSQVYIMNGDGSDSKQISFDYANDTPVWLPEGKRIALRTTDTKGLWWWRVINIKTDEITTFSKPSYDFFYQTPAFAPDGQYIAYMSLVEQKLRNDGSSQIHVKNVDGSNDLALTHDIWANIDPEWSPDSQRIAFLSERDGTYNEFALYVMAKDGTKLQKLTIPNYTENATLSWSPDGQQLAISDMPPGKINIIDINTANTTKLLNLQEGEWAYSPSWQP